MTSYPRIFLALYALAAVAWVARSHHGLDYQNKPLGYDFITVWAASRLALSGTPAAAYDVAGIAHAEWAAVPGNQSITPWMYPPNFYLLILPASLLPFYWSCFVFTGSTFLAYFAVVRRAFAHPAGRLLLLAFPGVFVNAAQGQYGFLTAALMGGGLLSLPRSPALAGALLGLLSMKPHLGLLVPLALLAGGEWRALLWAFLSASLSMALGVAVLGSETVTGLLAEYQAFSGWVTQSHDLLVKVPSFFSFAFLLGVPKAAAYALHGTVAVCVAAAMCWIWRLRPGEPQLRSAALVTASLLWTPYLVDYDLVWLALPIAWIAREALRSGWLPWEREVLASAWLLPLLVAPLCSVTGVQPGPFVLLALFLVILRRAVRSRAASGAGGEGAAAG